MADGEEVPGEEALDAAAPAEESTVGGMQLFCFCQEDAPQRTPRGWLEMYNHGSHLGRFYVEYNQRNNVHALDIYWSDTPRSLRDSIDLVQVDDLEVLDNEGDGGCTLPFDQRRFQIVTTQGQSYVFETEANAEFSAPAWFDFLNDILLMLNVDLIGTGPDSIGSVGSNTSSKSIQRQQMAEEAARDPSSNFATRGRGAALPEIRKSTSKGSAGFKKIRVLKSGMGAQPRRGQLVHVHWTGYGKSGDPELEFWTANDFAFEVGQSRLFKGFDEAVRTMKEGEEALFTCAAEYGYGAAGHAEMGVLPDTTLKYQIELTHVEEKYFGH